MASDAVIFVPAIFPTVTSSVISGIPLIKFPHGVNCEGNKDNKEEETAVNEKIFAALLLINTSFKISGDNPVFVQNNFKVNRVLLL